VENSLFNSGIIASVRQKHGLSQEELAHLLGVSFSSVNAWESGKRRPQTRMQEVIVALAQKEKISRLPDTLARTLFLDFDEPSGIIRSDAGYVSSILSYNRRRDPLDLTQTAGSGNRNKVFVNRR
jgi:putative transcriptional regulator